MTLKACVIEFGFSYNGDIVSNLWGFVFTVKHLESKCLDSRNKTVAGLPLYEPRMICFPPGGPPHSHSWENVSMGPLQVPQSNPKYLREPEST